jgi:hypothetical protein
VSWSNSPPGWAAAALVAFSISRAAPAAQGALVVQRSHRGAPQFLRISADGRWAATGGFPDPELRVWDLVDRALVATIPAYVAACDFSTDGRLLVVASSHQADQPAELWLYRIDALDGGPLAHKTLEKDQKILDVGFFPNRGDVAITGGSKVSVWRDAARNGPVVLVSDRAKPGPVLLAGHALAFSRDGTRWLAGGRVWSGDAFAPVAAIDIAGAPAGISPDGQLVYLLLPGTIEGRWAAVGTFSLARHALVATYKPPGAELEIDLRRVDVARDGTVYIWNQDNGVRSTLFQLGKAEGHHFAASGSRRAPA